MTPAAIEALRREILATSHALHARGWVANHDGNLSARLDDPGEPELRVLSTPTSVSKGDVAAETLVVIDAERRVVEGTRRPPSEVGLHLAAYRARPDIRVVLHAHPPTATGFAVAGVPLPHPFLAEAAVSLGPVLPVVPWSPPGDPQAERDLASALAQADVVILDRHGVLAVGGSFEQALLRLELVEHLARIALVAQQLGGVRPLSSDQVAALCARGRPGSDPARAPAAEAPPAGPSPTASLASPSSALTGARPDVRAVVSDALSRFR